MSHPTIRVAASLVAALVLLVPTRGAAGGVPVWGGPAYDPPTQTGYQSPDLPVAAGATAGNAMAVGGGFKYIDGQVLGTRALRWDASGNAAVELGNLGTDADGITNTVANAINAAGFAVGEAHKYTNGVFDSRRAVLWGPGGAAAIDLNTLIDPAAGWTPSESRGISDGNWVGGVGLFDPDGAGPLSPYSRAFLLDVSGVVPEPASTLTMFLGAMLFQMHRRRRRRRRPVSRHPAERAPSPGATV